MVSALEYSDRFDYPLTGYELWFWQIKTRFSKTKVLSIFRHSSLVTRHYYYLPGRSKLVKLRKAREQISVAKWAIARSVAKDLSRIPTIEAIFVTGALAMNNSPKDDDIDFMIVTKPNTLWLTRLLVIFLLGSRRRPTLLPEHSSPRVSNTICDNLYLDSNHLLISNKNLYTAHEILQAKCIYDRSNIAHRFIASNPWAEEYLPIAYRESLKKFNSSEFTNLNFFGISNLVFRIFVPINAILFLAQLLYMKPKMTNEDISLNTAFFHPRAIVNH